MITTRWSNPDDAEALARIQRDSWRFAYQGLLPPLALERRAAAHGPHWWANAHDRGNRALVVSLDERPLGYATLGPARAARRAGLGEVYELYVAPEVHGAGLGGRLFDTARQELDRRGHPAVVVWALAANEAGCRFYRDRGGRAVARGLTRIEGVPFEQLGFVWSADHSPARPPAPG
jgi:GNAT superfamily N-acetyltransferase